MTPTLKAPDNVVSSLKISLITFVGKVSKQTADSDIALAGQSWPAVRFDLACQMKIKNMCHINGHFIFIFVR